jgi:hypothetical protein
MPEHANGDHAVGPRADPSVTRLKDRIHVDGPLDRLAHAAVRQLRILGVHAHPCVKGTRLVQQLRMRRQGLRIAGGRVRRDRGTVELARFEGQFGRLEVLDVDQMNFLKIGLGPDPIGVRLQHRSLLRFPIGHRVGAKLSRHRYGVLLVLHLLDKDLRHEAA